MEAVSFSGLRIANFLGNYLAALLLSRSMRLTRRYATGPGLARPDASSLGGKLLLTRLSLPGGDLHSGGFRCLVHLTRAVPDETESAGGLFVAAINFATLAARRPAVYSDHSGSGRLPGERRRVLAFVILCAVDTRLTAQLKDASLTLVGMPGREFRLSACAPAKLLRH